MKIWLTIVDDFLRILERVLRYFGDRYRLYQGHKSVKVHEMGFLMSYGEGIFFPGGSLKNYIQLVGINSLCVNI